MGAKPKLTEVGKNFYNQMSLNFQFTDLERFNHLSDDERKLNDCFIWGSLIIGLRSITEQNASEWVWRLKYDTDLNGASWLLNGEPYVPTLEDVRKRIGLTTNVSNLTRKQFIAKSQRIHDRI